MKFPGILLSKTFMNVFVNKIQHFLEQSTLIEDEKCSREYEQLYMYDVDKNVELMSQAAARVKARIALRDPHLVIKNISRRPHSM